ncbi:MAG: glycosyltransferase family 2 protein [Elusimicrobiota bacterium]
MRDSPLLSVLIPVYNEEENLPDLGREIREALPGVDYEVVFIDDGSTDSSFERIRELCKAEPRFKALRLGTNFGQTAAMAAGIAEARGGLIAMLDSDLQNDPKDIPAMLAAIEQGFDVVSGWRKDRKDPWLTRRLPSQTANAIISRVTGVRLHDYGCTLKLYRAEYLKPLRLCGEMHRFIPALAGFMGARVTERVVHHRPRTRGKSKYGLIRIFKVLLDLLTVKFMDSWMTKPNYLFGGGGCAMLLVGALLSGVTLYERLFKGIYVKDQPLFQVSIFFCLVGVQLLVLGLLAEIMIRVYYDVREKPTYHIRERI